MTVWLVRVPKYYGEYGFFVFSTKEKALEFAQQESKDRSYKLDVEDLELDAGRAW